MNKSKLFLAIICLILLSGCAAGRYETRHPFYRKEEGTYHRVQKGETLWSISRYYNIELESLVRANYLPDAAKINSGQLIFIPGIKEDSFRPGKEIAHNNNFIWPAKGEITSFFGSKKGDVKNKGIDIAAKASSDVYASRSGKVKFCDEMVKGYGKTLILDHGDGFLTLYAHNSKILVKVGDYVRQGDKIATIGSSGRADSPLLHFEIRKKSRPQNPFYYLP